MDEQRTDTPQQRLLEVENLRITFSGRRGKLEAVKGISFGLGEGKIMAVVGESGSGKSVSALSLTRLLPQPPACKIEGSIRYNGQEVMQMKSKQLRKLRGKELAYIFQEPSSSLNPVFTVGTQIAEAIRMHIPEADNVRERTIAALERVGIRDPHKRVDAYPHEMSGGMQQRVMIAMALACEPRILIADEPTTALDVTIQKQIIELLQKLREETKMSILLITHNFGIVRGVADDVLVMYRGDIVERGSSHEVLGHPRHPYTKALIACIPRLGARQKRLTTINHKELENV